jgi:hypothetical protein
MDDNSIIAPNAPILSFSPEAETDIETQSDEATEERQLFSLTQHPGWLPFVERSMEKIDALRKLKNADVAGKSYEEVGQIWLVANEAANLAESMLTDIKAIAAGIQDVA